MESMCDCVCGSGQGSARFGVDTQNPRRTESGMLPTVRARNRSRAAFCMFVPGMLEAILDEENEECEQDVLDELSKVAPGSSATLLPSGRSRDASSA